MKNLFKILVMLLAVTLFSCSKDSVPTQKSQIAVNFQIVKTPFTTQAIDNTTQTKQSSTTGVVSFNTGYFAISALEFEAESESSAVEVEFELEQNTVIDFATGTTTPDINVISIPAGTYDEVSVEIELRNNSKEPSILLNGIYTAADGSENEVRLEFFSDESFEVEREGKIIFETDQAAIAQITFDPSLWFVSVTNEHFTKTTKDANGIIVISSTQNTQIYDLVAEEFELASEIEVEDADDFEDEDEDDEE